MNKINTKAFTLVELIVVITILAILGTIAFISLQSYTVYARDSVRLSNLRTIESSLKIQYTQGGAYAVPDESVNITASGTIIRKQGVFGKQALRTVKLNSDASKDPLTGEYYDYVVGANLSEYQLVGYMEGEEVSLATGVNAVNDGTLKTLGTDLGFFSSGGLAFHKNGGNIGQTFDIKKPNEEYTVTFNNTSSFSGTGNSLLVALSSYDNKIAYLNEELVLFYNMETFIKNGTTTLLRDLSAYGNHGECINSSGSFNCGEEGNTPSFEIVGKKAAFFERVEKTYIKAENSESLDLNNEFSIGVWIKGNTDTWSTSNYTRTGVVGKGRDSYTLTIYGAYGLTSLWINGSNTDFGHNTLKNNEWNHLVAVYNGNSANMYVNGILVGTSILSGEVIPSAVPFRVGVSATDIFFNGYIDDVFMYNRALSEKEVNIIYESTIN